MSELNKSALSFNQGVKDMFRLFKDMPSTLKGKLHITELQSKMMAGMRTEPAYAITFLGPLVWQARVEIAGRNAAFFLARRYEIDVARLCREHNVNYDDAINTINFMKDAYRTASADQQTIIMDQMQVMLHIVVAREMTNRSTTTP